MNVSHVSGIKRVLYVETRPYFEVFEYVKDCHHQTAVHAHWNNFHYAVHAG